MPDSTFEIWLAPLRPRALRDDTLLLAAPDQIRTWVGDRFGALLHSSAATVLGAGTQVLLTDPDAPLPAAAEPAAAVRADDDSELHPKLTFEQFVIGRSNRLAHAAALAVAENPGQTYNPLFLYGPPGQGKTHLLQAIADYIRRGGSGLRVRFTTAERFTNEFVAAIQAGGTKAFKARYRDTDVLLIDDVQFLQSKVKTEEEFFHTFNALHETGSQLVLSCDRLPDDMASLEQRLRERFQAGLIAELEPPDFCTRLAILRKRAQHDGLELEDGTLDAIAHRITSNARTLEGALIRVVAFHSLTGRPIDAQLADEVLAGLYPAPRSARPTKPPTIDRVQQLTCEAFDVTPEDLVSAARNRRIVRARQVAMLLARRHTGATLPAIGERFGGRNHTTVMYACRTADERIQSDPATRAVVQDLEERLAAPDGDRPT